MRMCDLTPQIQWHLPSWYQLNLPHSCCTSWNTFKTQFLFIHTCIDDKTYQTFFTVDFKIVQVNKNSQLPKSVGLFYFFLASIIILTWKRSKCLFFNKVMWAWWAYVLMRWILNFSLSAVVLSLLPREGNFIFNMSNLKKQTPRKPATSRKHPILQTCLSMQMVPFSLVNVKYWNWVTFFIAF